MDIRRVEAWMIPVKYFLLLQTFDTLQELDLSECALQDQVVPLLSRFPKLVKLNLSASFMYLAKHSKYLSKIDHIDTQLGGVFSELTKLKWLNLSHFPGSCACLDSLPQTLEVLRLKHCRGTYISGLLPAFCNLIELRLTDTRTLTQLPPLETVAKDYPLLQVLDLRCKHDINNLCPTKKIPTPFQNITALYLEFGCGCPYARDKERNDTILINITDKRCRLKDTLRILYFPGCKANSMTLCRIKRLTNLRALNLHSAENRESILNEQFFANLSALEAINIGGPGKFAMGSLSSMGQCPLEWVNLAGANFSSDDARGLLSRLVHYRNPLTIYVQRPGHDHTFASNLHQEFMGQFDQLIVDAHSHNAHWSHESLYL